VRHEDDCYPQIGSHTADIGPQFIFKHSVYLTKGLIKQQYFGSGDNCPCNRYPLLFASAEIDSTLLCEVINSEKLHYLERLALFAFEIGIGKKSCDVIVDLG